ncbi:hypothetical protein DFH08DRAFT_1076741 [Mycena albidolilacea]|uniref:Secreted protein n=1 Tax=Mycena albidolilacea TaxID=1033008 RepID=A0AAD7ADJ7_9AGAR|nr:hypothetical protein DFH08DRAFT_1076741 [Mycena albidolilacea]
MTTATTATMAIMIHLFAQFLPAGAVSSWISAEFFPCFLPSGPTPAILPGPWPHHAHLRPQVCPQTCRCSPSARQC